MFFIGGQCLCSLALLFIASCAPEASPGASRIEPTLHEPREGNTWNVGPLPKSRTVGTNPITLKVEEDEHLRRVLAGVANDSSKVTLRLILCGVEPAIEKTETRYGIKIYVNVPDNDEIPTADSAHYVGMVSPFESKEKDLAVDIAPVLRKLIAKKLWKPDDPLRITLVAAPVNPKKQTKDAEFRLTQVKLQLPEKVERP
jgi:hypothetical protein